MNDKEKLNALDAAISAYVNIDHYKDVNVLQALLEVRADLKWRIEHVNKEVDVNGDII